MWKLSLKIWIVTIMLNTVSCKVARYNTIPSTSTTRNNIESANPSSSAPCATCGSDPSISIPFEKDVDDSMKYPENTQNAGKRNLRQVSNEIERSPVVDPPSGMCRPELELYVFGNPREPSVVYEPKCTRINRCSGCCKSKFRSCQPTSIRMTKFRVLQKNDSISGTIFDQAIVSVEEHLSCDCLCIAKKESCSIEQEFNANSCRCECRNRTKKEECEREHKLKRWDVDTCSCVCRNVEQCQTNSGFDPSSCSCKPGYIPFNVQESNIDARRRSPENTYSFTPFYSIETLRRKHKGES